MYGSRLNGWKTISASYVLALTSVSLCLDLNKIKCSSRHSLQSSQLTLINIVTTCGKSILMCIHSAFYAISRHSDASKNNLISGTILTIDQCGSLQHPWQVEVPFGRTTIGGLIHIWMSSVFLPSST